MDPPPVGLRMPGGRGQTVRFSFNGELILAFAGETLAAALLASGIRVFGHSPVDGSSRGLFCAMGACQECVIKVDGSLVEACRTLVRDGMSIMISE
jgi:predicted molibdopterin-dependent oxidoreductase YjgC